MKPVPLPIVLLIAFFPSMNAFAESEINTTASFDPALCTQESQLNSALNQTTDLLTTVASLMATCPDNAVQIAALASNLNPSLTREIYLVLFSDVADDQRVQLAVDAVRSIDQERRADVVQAAIESAPQELAQAIVDAVAEAGLMDPTEIIIAAIAGGADPGSITEPTAAGIATPPPIALAPGLTNTFGTGNGNGGGTASPN
ncbi:hypothetical protein ACOCGP_003062 [Vibrio cholerae]|uniref:hypothetical protein n=1 Tax=Vibrio cholerae TaxID=666 RepID=UPI00084210AE|nr:hypothetical protein [Vibrio cholerae]EGQ9613219.1 hypothetical protein [Vibrio cholerae]EHZ7428838.1 hypothetical protein [Vibrio cholerae]EIJ0934025.1 hypothetical protein [Vibrio cholerae]EJL6363706.1 hypothetical protein [Vibrio cholerae]EJL6507120.1 hypothetical protein [Vibrio cholerae]